MQYYKKGCHTTHDCTYHIVWITKYRYPVLAGNIALRTRALIREICGREGVEIIRGNVGKDHVHLYVSTPPYIMISRLVQFMKGKSSRKLQLEFRELKQRYWGKHLWAIGYFVRTTGNVSDKVIKEYIENQGKDDHFGDFQVES